MSALPELPSCADSPKQRMVSFADCKSYGDARAAHARKQALEEAAKVCETQIDPTRPCTTSGFAYWHAKQIKELK